MGRSRNSRDMYRLNSANIIRAVSTKGLLFCGAASLALILQACDPVPNPELRVTVRDSAGISIVENRVPAGDGLRSWSVESEPLLRIGAGLHGPADVLFRVRGAAELRDGNIAVANAGSHEVRIYAMSGDLERVAGGRGWGPGEFEDISSFVLGPADTLFAFDDRQLRVAVFDPDGNFVETRRLSGLTTRVTGLRGVLDDGSLILSPSRLLDAGTASGVRTWIDSIPLLQSTGGQVAPMPIFDWAEMYETPSSYGMVQFGGSNYELIVFRGNSVRESTGYSGSLIFKNLRGEVLQISRWPAVSRTFEPAAMLSWAQGTGASEEQVQGLSRSLREEEFRYPDSVQAYDRHVVDSQGNSWLRRFLFPWEEIESRQAQWDLISATGHWLGHVGLSPRFSPTEIGEDYLLGIAKSPDGVEEVHLYHLERT